MDDPLPQNQTACVTLQVDVSLVRKRNKSHDHARHADRCLQHMFFHFVHAERAGVVEHSPGFLADIGLVQNMTLLAKAHWTNECGRRLEAFGSADKKSLRAGGAPPLSNLLANHEAVVRM